MSLALLWDPEHKSGMVMAATVRNTRQIGSPQGSRWNKLCAPWFLSQHGELSTGGIYFFLLLFHLNAVGIRFKMCLSPLSISSLVIILLQIPCQHTRKKCQREFQLQHSIAQWCAEQKARGETEGFPEIPQRTLTANPLTEACRQVAVDSNRNKAVIIMKSMYHRSHFSPLRFFLNKNSFNIQKILI